MALSMVEKPDTCQSKVVAVVGGTCAAIEAALILAQMGVGVKLITASSALGWDIAGGAALGDSSLDQRLL
jgi:heterodisulfide reductase subunit A-like polyferredoxin